MTKLKTLIVVESPAKIKTILKYVSGDYIVRATFGHIFDLTSGGKDGIGVNLDKDFELKFKVMPDKKDKLKAILDATRECKEIIIATDGDREGESIGADIAKSLQSSNLLIKRTVFKEITKKGISDGLANLTNIDENIVQAQRARRALDRIVGFLVSPFIIKSFGPNLSAGRVQSVAVRIVVDREREIENFKPEEYWNITTALAKPNSLSEGFVAKYINKVADKATASKIKDELDKDSYIISELEEKEKKRNPYPPLITSSLATSAAAKYKFQAARTMKAAQSLYEAGLITYMRTDSVRCSPDSIDACRDWLKQNKHDIPAKQNFYANKNDAQDAHEAIRPTDVTKLHQNIYRSEDEIKIYKLIWERFVASQMNPALYDTVSATVKSSSDHILKANGRVLKYKGWLEITGDGDDDDEGEAKLPMLKRGDSVVLVPPKVKAEQKFTQPPPRYSEKTLIKELEKKGIGRPSTYAAIMSKITDRNYVIRKSDMFIPSDLGKDVVDALVKNFTFIEYKYTSIMEEKLDQIADGKLKYVEMLQDFYQPFKGQLKKAIASSDKDYGIECAKCKSPMKLKQGKFGSYMACVNYPDKCKNTYSCEIVDGKPVAKENKPKQNVSEDVLCPQCSSGMVKRSGKYGNFYACSERSCGFTKKI